MIAALKHRGIHHYRTMSSLTTFRSLLDNRTEAITHSNPIKSTEHYIKYAQPWPVNKQKDSKGDAEPPTKKQKKEDQDQSGFKQAQALIGTKFSKDTYVSVPFIKRKEINDDTRIYTFKSERLGLGVGQHILCGFMMNDGLVERPYAITRPTGSDKDDGSFDVLVKTAFPNDDAGGLVSNVMDLLSSERGDEMLVRGPEGPISYDDGSFIISKIEGSIDDAINADAKTEEKRVSPKKVNFVTGGTGMTPIYATIKTILERGDPLEIRFLNANKTKEDVLLDDELLDLEKRYSDKFNLIHVLEHPPKDWDGKTGRIEKSNLELLFKPDGDDVVSLVCGPPPMLEAAKSGLLEMGFVEDETFFHY